MLYRSFLNNFSVSRLVLLKLTVAFMLLGSPSKSANLESRLFEVYASGDMNTLRNLIEEEPDSTAAGQFFKGVFEEDGEAARFFYDRVVVMWPGSVAEGWALDKLWQYHFAKGDLNQSEKFWGFLKLRHPEHHGLKINPDFESESNLLQKKPPPTLPLSSLKPRSGGWGVQVGAFGKQAGAEATANRVEHFGTVMLVPKSSNGKQVTAVIVGSFQSQAEASRMAVEIKRATGLSGRVVTLNN